MPVSYSDANKDCGSIYLGRSASVTVSVSNPTGAAITLELVGADRGAFTIQSGSPVPAGATGQVVKIGFMPSAVRSFTAYLRDTTATGSGDPRVTLQGVGLTPDTVLVDREDLDSDGTIQADEVSRFKIHVPYTNTTLVMGRGATAPQTYDGFGLRTDQRAFVRAGQSVMIQSSGDTVIQAYDATNDDAESSLYGLAQYDATLAGVNSVNLISPSGALISAGFGGVGSTPLKLSDMDGERADVTDDDKKDGIHAVLKSRQAAGVVLSAFDAFLALGLTAYNVKQNWSSGKDALESKSRSKKLSVAAGAVASGAGVLAAAFSTASAAGASALGGATIFGAGGVMLASPTFSSFYSLLGLVQASLYPVTIGLDTSLMALKACIIHSGSTLDLYSNRKTHVHSVNRVRITSGGGFPGFHKPGKINMEADAILIGEDDNTPSKTRNVEVTAHDKITLISDGAVVTGGYVSPPSGPPSEIKVDGTKSAIELAVGTKTKITVKDAKNSIRLQSADTFLILENNKIANLAKDTVLLNSSKGGSVSVQDVVTIKGQKVSIL